jgi:hypothetical protein
LSRESCCPEVMRPVGRIRDLKEERLEGVRFVGEGEVPRSARNMALVELLGRGGLGRIPTGNVAARPDLSFPTNWTDPLLTCWIDRVMDDLSLRVILDASIHLREQAVYPRGPPRLSRTGIALFSGDLPNWLNVCAPQAGSLPKSVWPRCRDHGPEQLMLPEGSARAYRPPNSFESLAGRRRIRN